MKKYRAAVVGCGRIGVTMESDPKRIKPATHAGALQSDPSTQLCALVDSDPKQLARSQLIFPGVPTYSDCEEMLRRCRPDIVSVATPPEQHRSVTELCARNGVPAIICEKPIAATAEDARSMIEVCGEHRSLLFIDHSRRFDPLVNRVRGEVKAGRIGEIIQVSTYYTAGLFNTGTHLIDLLRFFIGEEVRWVNAFKEERFSCPPGDLNVNGWLVFEGGITATLQALEVRDYSIFDMHLYGRKGRLIIDRFGFSVERTPLRDCVDFAGYMEMDVDHRNREGTSRSLMAPIVEHVVACLEGREKPVSRGEDGLAAFKVLLALQESAEAGGRKIKVAD